LYFECADVDLATNHSGKIGAALVVKQRWIVVEGVKSRIAGVNGWAAG